MLQEHKKLSSEIKSRIYLYNHISIFPYEYMENTIYKICRVCKQEKPLIQFPWRDKLKETFRTECKACIKLIRQERYYKNIIKIKERRTAYWHKNKEKLSLKNKKYREDNKEKLKLYYKSRHKERRAADIRYKARNKEKYKELRRKLYAANKEKYRQKNRKYREKHIEQIKELQRKHEKRSRAEIPGFKLRKNISRQILTCLKKNNGTKEGVSIFKYLPYSFYDLKKHIESQFEPWMNWNNHGNYRQETWNDNDPTTWTWQIDHIIPQKLFPYTSMKEENFRKCWDLTNLRPLSAKENVLKRDKYEK